MSTRARIILKTENGDYYSIYLHHDGYLSYAGEVLKRYYTEKEKVRKLITLGDLSSLGNSLDNCVSYFGWRLENSPYDKIKNEELDNYLSNLCDYGWEEYVYMFKEEEENWYVYEVGIDKYTPEKWKILE